MELVYFVLLCAVVIYLAVCLVRANNNKYEYAKRLLDVRSSLNNIENNGFVTMAVPDALKEEGN